jgi:hypothetical protein
MIGGTKDTADGTTAATMTYTGTGSYTQILLQASITNPGGKLPVKLVLSSSDAAHVLLVQGLSLVIGTGSAGAGGGGGGGGANGLKTTAAAATVTTTTEVIVAQLPIPANSLKVGSVFRVSTSYHPAATTIITGRLRVGSAGTTSDAAVVTCYATAATNAGTRYAECISGVQAIGASATHLGAGQEEVGAIGASGVQAATSGTFNSTVANYVSFSLQNTSSTTTTVYAAALEILSN